MYLKNTVVLIGLLVGGVLPIGSAKADFRGYAHGGHSHELEQRNYPRRYFHSGIFKCITTRSNPGDLLARQTNHHSCKSAMKQANRWLNSMRAKQLRQRREALRVLREKERRRRDAERYHRQNQKRKRGRHRPR